MPNPLAPSDIAVYRQPGRDAPKWKTRGITVVVGYEAERDASGVPTVSVAAWDASWNAAGVRRIREPYILAQDSADPGLVGLLYLDEPDNLIVQYQDTNPAAEESVYLDAAAWCNATRAGAPNKPTVVNLGLEQIQWTRPDGRPKVDYARLCQPFDCVMVDWYAVHRGRPVADYGTLIDKLIALIGPGKVIGAFCECSWQNLDPTAYPHQRAPTPAEFIQTLDLVKARGLAPGLFPQHLGNEAEPGRPKTDFEPDAMPPEIVAALAAWRIAAAPNGPGSGPGPQTQPGPQNPPPAPGDPAKLLADVTALRADLAEQKFRIDRLELAVYAPGPAPPPEKPAVKKKK